MTSVEAPKAKPPTNTNEAERLTKVTLAQRHLGQSRLRLHWTCEIGHRLDRRRQSENDVLRIHRGMRAAPWSKPKANRRHLRHRRRRLSAEVVGRSERSDDRRDDRELVYAAGGSQSRRNDHPWRPDPGRACLLHSWDRLDPADRKRKPADHRKDVQTGLRSKRHRVQYTKNCHG